MIEIVSENLAPRARFWTLFRVCLLATKGLISHFLFSQIAKSFCVLDISWWWKQIAWQEILLINNLQYKWLCINSLHLKMQLSGNIIPSGSVFVQKMKINRQILLNNNITSIDFLAYAILLQHSTITLRATYDWYCFIL